MQSVSLLSFASNDHGSLAHAVRTRTLVALVLPSFLPERTFLRSASVLGLHFGRVTSSLLLARCCRILSAVAIFAVEVHDADAALF